MLEILSTSIISEELLKWIPGIVDKCRGPVSYSDKLNDGTIVKQHVDHVKICQLSDDIAESEDDFYAIPVSIDESPSTVELCRSNCQRHTPWCYYDDNT